MMSTIAHQFNRPAAGSRITTAEIEAVVGQIAARFNPQKIVLFGSYAYGRPHPESDIDLLVVLESTISPAQQAADILCSINYSFGLDLLVYTPERITTRLAWGDPFLLEVMSKGKVMYESASG